MIRTTKKQIVVTEKGELIVFESESERKSWEQKVDHLDSWFCFRSPSVLYDELVKASIAHEED